MSGGGQRAAIGVVIQIEAPVQDGADPDGRSTHRDRDPNDKPCGSVKECRENLTTAVNLR
jgi:hypothetical protein